jgi:hypothetical protein
MRVERSLGAIHGRYRPVDHAVGKRPQRCGKPLHLPGDDRGTTLVSAMETAVDPRRTSARCGQGLDTRSLPAQAKGRVVHNPQALLLTLIRLTIRHGQGVL